MIRIRETQRQAQRARAQFGGKAQLERYRAEPAAFIEECLVSPYDGRPYRLNDAERHFMRFAFELDDTGRLEYPLLLYSAIKKSRKTEFAALLAITVIWLFGGR